MDSNDIVKIEKIEHLGDLDLYQILRSWVDCQEDYTDLHSSFDMAENGWWHNERASISLLAGSAWKAGWVALEEFGTTKRGRKNKAQEASDRVGRCDLYLCNRRVSLAIEAKQAWQGIGEKIINTTKNVKEQIGKAWIDTSRLHSYEADRRFAVTFIVPYLPVSQVWDSELNAIDSNRLQSSIVEWLDEVGDFKRFSTKPVHYAYYFPADRHRYFNEYTKRVFPGVVIILEERFRGG